jgi:hypothetical protein
MPLPFYGHYRLQIIEDWLYLKQVLNYRLLQKYLHPVL